MNDSNLIGRRHFLRQGACVALKATGLVAALSNLRLIGGALASDSSLSAAASGPADYRALVCVFLYGGNDANNLLIPTESSAFQLYQGARAELALDPASLLPLQLIDGRSFALHPSAPEIASLFNAGKLNFLSNVGTLVAPITRRDYVQGSSSLPRQLFSHADQAMQWQTSRPDTANETTGWGGRVADLLQAMNETSKVSICVSLAGTNTLQAGNSTYALQLSTSGPVGINAITSPWAEATRKTALTGLLQLERQNLFEQNFAAVNQRSLENYERIKGALDNVAVPAGFGSDSLASQLRLIARMISAGPGLGIRRQIFFAALGGWDTHDQQLTAQATNIQRLSQALGAFQAAIDGYGMADQVTLFSASDFGRTLTSNGKGSDHGWGSHHLVMGGAVAPRTIRGTFPSMLVKGEDDTDQGRWIPSTSVDQFSAAMARWLGVAESELPTILPNINRFSSSDLGLFKPGALA